MILSTTQIQALIAVGTIALSFGAGSTVQGWRLDAQHANALIAKQDELHKLELKLGEQNNAITMLNYQTEQAKLSSKQAWVRVAALEKSSQSRTGAASSIAATTCSAMVEQLKGIPR